MWIYKRISASIGVFCIVVLYTGVDAFAGATASQWVIVVNGQSKRSLTIANHYCSWRNVPASNVIVLDNVPAKNTISMAEFREQILDPILSKIASRKLAFHIQGIAYSADFPTAIDLSAEPKPLGKQAEFLTPVGSINGLTYLYRLVKIDNTSYIAYNNNFYAQRTAPSLFSVPFSDSNTEMEDKIKALRDKGEYYRLGEVLDEQLGKKPHQYPLAYMSAQAWSKAGESAKALQRLQQAIETGWSYSKYTQEDEHFERLREYNGFQALIRSCENDPFDWTPTVAFDARKFYSPNGAPSFDPALGYPYILSFALAVCTTTGNTEEEALRQLKSSVDADFSHPEGIFYITKTDDVRTKCREASFQIACDRLKSLGFEAEIINQSIPTSKKCLGVTMGSATFAWGATGSTLLPGAIGDNLTSHGGEMDNPAQTKLTEFLRHGAAAASGTVTEPYSVQAKFPFASIHASYAAGLTAAEAYYSSVAGPYQLLIAGDPLCQPFATPPRFKIVGLENGSEIEESTQLELHPSDEPKSTKPRHISLLLDGQFQGKLGFPARVSLSNQKIPTGAHELRFIGTDDTRLELRWEDSIWVTSGPEHVQVRLSGPAKWKSTDKKPLVVKVLNSDTDATVEIRHNKNTIATLSENETSCEIPLDKVGTGPVRLQAVAITGQSEVASMPITILIE